MSELDFSMRFITSAGSVARTLPSRKILISTTGPTPSHLTWYSPADNCLLLTRIAEPSLNDSLWTSSAASALTANSNDNQTTAILEQDVIFILLFLLNSSCYQP